MCIFFLTTRIINFNCILTKLPIVLINLRNCIFYRNINIKTVMQYKSVN